jgi:hypothetical protein
LASGHVQAIKTWKQPAASHAIKVTQSSPLIPEEVFLSFIIPKQRKETKTRKKPLPFKPYMKPKFLRKLLFRLPSWCHQIVSYKKSSVAKMIMYAAKKPWENSDTPFGLKLINDKMPNVAMAAASKQLKIERSTMKHLARELR